MVAHFVQKSYVSPLWNTKVCYSAYKSLTLVPRLSQMNYVGLPIRSFFKIYIRLQLSSGRFPSCFPAGVLYIYILSLPIHSGTSIYNGSYCTPVRYAGFSRSLLLIIWSVNFCFLPYEHFNVCVGFEVPTTVVMNISLGYNAV
jgi:hypothetical protein